MTPQTLLQEVSRFASGARDGGIEPEILQDARRRTTDIIGIALAASGMEPARIVGGLIEGWGGEEQASVIGRGDRYPAASAALMNGTLAHSLDYDDTHLPSVLHPSAAVVPAALAAAGVQEFVFVLAPLKIVGGTGSPVRPLALVHR